MVGETDEAYEQRLLDLLDQHPTTQDELTAFLEREPELRDRLDRLRARRAASEKSLAQQSPDEDWDVGKLPGGREIQPVRPGEPLNPTNMSDQDLAALRSQLEARTPQTSAIKRQLDWIDHEQTYRETRGAAAQSAAEYDQTVRAAGEDVDRADAALLERAVSRGDTTLWVSSEDEARRIFDTLDEMARRPGGQFRMRTPASPTDLPFRGPEWHPYPDKGANRATHFNVEYEYQGQSVNLHIYWPPVP
jgi:hypothetical protein